MLKKESNDEHVVTYSDLMPLNFIWQAERAKLNVKVVVVFVIHRKWRRGNVDGRVR
jgi:hypothetical protein